MKTERQTDGEIKTKKHQINKIILMRIKFIRLLTFFLFIVLVKVSIILPEHGSHLIDLIACRTVTTTSLAD